MLIYSKRSYIIRFIILLFICAVMYAFYYFLIPYKVNKGCTVTITTRKGKTYTYTATVEWARIMGGRPNIRVCNDIEDDE